MSAVTNYRPKPNVFHLSAQEVAKSIDIKLTRWPGNCFGIATAMVEAKVVDGDAVYGHWLGPVAKSCKMFSGKPIIQHGWILQKDGTVIDPTRFVFEGLSPYIWEGNRKYHVECDDFESGDSLDPECQHCGHLCTEHSGRFFKPCKVCLWPYDEGGNRWREQTMQPAPDCNKEYRDGARWGEMVRWQPGREVASVVDILFGTAKRKKGFLTRDQLHWLANVPYDMFTPVASADYAPHVYAMLDKLGLLCHVPLDNQRRAERARRDNLKALRKLVTSR